MVRSTERSGFVERTLAEDAQLMRLRIVIHLDTDAGVECVGDEIEDVHAEVAVGAGQKIHEGCHAHEVGEIRATRIGSTCWSTSDA